jgi:hypothetical protein
MSITVDLPNEKLAKAFLAAKPDNVDAKNVTVKVAKKGKRLGVMSITKLENVQLGLILQYIYKNEDVVLPESVLQFPDALDKLVSRYST